MPRTFYGLMIVVKPEWNHGQSVKSVLCAFDDFEEMVEYSETDGARAYAERYAREMASESYGWDYFQEQVSLERLKLAGSL